MKVYIETYGCQMNVADSELIRSILKNDKFSVVEDIADADVIIFNTCSVRQHAEDRVLGRINNEMSRKRNKKNLKIGVIGCMAQRLDKKLNEMNSNIDFVVGVDQYKKLPEIINGLFEEVDFKCNTIVIIQLRLSIRIGRISIKHFCTNISISCSKSNIKSICSCTHGK